MNEYIYELLKSGKRLDGRRFEELREIKVELDVVKRAEGSASVKFGDTHVIAGAKLEIGEPFPDSPNEGILIVNAEFSPLASPDFEPGPPGEDAIELARVVDRGMRESNCLNLEEFCIVPKEKVWKIFVDIAIINHCGNLLDASFLASVLALASAKIPRLEGDKIIREEFEKKIELKFKPVMITVFKFGNSYLLDPTFEEEKFLEASLSICLREDKVLCALQKMGRGTFKFEEVEKLVELAAKKSEELRKYYGY